jgi:hypothetical protein
MKRVAIALLALGSVAMLAAPALATNLLLENFSYSDGALVTVSSPNWTTHSGTWTSATDIQVLGGIAKGDMFNGPDDNRLLSAARTVTDVTYACFKVRIPSVAGTPSTNYFAHFKNTSTSFPGKVFVTPKDGTFTFAVTVVANTPTAIWPTALAYDTWYTVAVKYDAVGRSATLWVDPVDESSASITATESTVAGIAVVAYALRQSNTVAPAGSLLWKWDVDDLGCADTFIDACETPVAVEPTTWGRIKSTYN